MLENELPRTGGTYTLVWRATAPATVQIGRLGVLRIQRGFYVYVGSAFGAGGLRARVGRHLKREKPHRWHVDYLRPFVVPTAVFFTTDPFPREHEWAETWLTMPHTAVPLPRFGASDCTCASHLFYRSHLPPNIQLPSVATHYRPIEIEIEDV